jgi:MYXO-CTERM domain-containing protein
MQARSGPGPWSRLRGAPILSRAIGAGATAWLSASAAQAAPTAPGTLVNPIDPVSECAGCHQFLPAQSGAPNESPYAWQGSLMANSARDPVFWAGVALAAQDAPGETSRCIRCHAPNAFLSGRDEAIEITELEGNDLDGVSCALCHRMVEDAAVPAGNGQYTIDDVLDGATVPRRGPWRYDMREPPPHSVVEADPYLGDSRLCGTCHDLTTAAIRRDANGNPTGALFNEQRTYSEWVNSDFSAPGSSFRSCQDCHMPAIADAAGCADFEARNITHPTGGRRHDLVGANLYVMRLLQFAYGGAGSQTIPDSWFDNSIARTQEFLRTAADLDVTPPAAIDLREGVDELAVRVTNLTGHKLPTGYTEGRVMWLQVELRYGDNLLWSSGRWDPTTRTIEDDAQARLYEGIAERWSDGKKFHLLLNDTWVSDTRIPPSGSRPNFETDPVGGRYTIQPDGTWPHFDDVTYTFPPLVLEEQPGVPPEVTIDVRLLYLINSDEYLEVLEADNVTNTAGSDLLALIDAFGERPLPMELARETFTVPLVGFDDPGATTTSGSSTSATGETTQASATTSGTSDETATASSGLTTGSSSATSGDSDATGSSDGVSTASAGGGATDGDGGCACRSAATDARPGIAASFGLLLLAAASRRRRRR